ncbi:MAG: hypothetical protein ACRERV_05425, partial [Methylococcales bacterium]
GRFFTDILTGKNVLVEERAKCSPGWTNKLRVGLPKFNAEWLIFRNVYLQVVTSRLCRFSRPCG